MKSFLERYTFILNYVYDKDNRPRVVVEAEQFYIQDAVEDICVQS